MMLQRPLGRTGHHSSAVIFGAAAFYVSSVEQATPVLDQALANGINHIDIAPGYGDAQAVAGPWISQHRHEIFLGCKTEFRTADKARADLDNSLKLLRTDTLDLYQLHAVTTRETLDQVFAPGGAFEVLRDAKEQGIARFLGITGHAMLAPALYDEALDRYPFDTLMFPLNARLYADPDYRRDTERLLDRCQRENVGVQIIKAIAKQPWAGREKTYGPWYEPYADYENIKQSIRFALSQPGVTCIASAADSRLLPHYYRAMQEYSPMSADEQAALIAARARDSLIFDGAEVVA